MEDREVACERCFNDPRLVDWIRASGSVANCGWCASENTKAVPLHALAEPFRNVAALYEEASGRYDLGDSIQQLLQEDWSIFSERIADDPTQLRELAVEILYAGLDPKEALEEPDYRGGFRRRTPWLEEEWDERARILLGTARSRQAPEEREAHLDEDPIQTVFEDLVEYLEPGSTFFRARIHDERARRERYELSDLGAPPPEKTTAGRANRCGVPVLYLATDRPTAISEVRGWKHAAIAVALVTPNRSLRIIDLSGPSDLESPFFVELLIWRVHLGRVLARLAEDLSRPVLPSDRETLYLPAHHLCDLARASGYDGIAYPSSLGPGHNIVVFEPAAADVTSLSYVRIEDVVHSFAELAEDEPVYDETPYDHFL